MTDRVDHDVAGFTVLDGVALVTGAAVASVHVRSAVSAISGPIGWGWAWCLFFWLALVSAGPYIWLVRKFFTRPEGYPRVGDHLWALAGIPWLFAAMVKTLDPSFGSKTIGTQRDDAYNGCLALSLAIVALISVPVLAARYLGRDPSQPRAPESTSRTHRFGVAIGMAWPIQSLVGLVLMN